jgi:hypothetical protein
VCDALLRPFPGADGYPSQLYFSVLVSSPYTRNWNVSNARICEKNWFAFSWKVNLSSPTLAQILIAHLTGFAKKKMTVEIRLTGALHREILRDLARPHPFAAERVGFASGHAGSLAHEGKLVGYVPRSSARSQRQDRDGSGG